MNIFVLAYWDNSVASTNKLTV